MKKATTTKRRSDCPISFGLDIFGDKWTLLILRDIMFYGRTRFSDFTPMEHIATNILADRLNTLEQFGIIAKERDPVLKNQNIYSVTQKGRDLLPTLIDLTLWGLQYDPHTPASKGFVQRLATEKEKIAQDITASIDRADFTTYRSSQMGIS